MLKIDFDIRYRNTNFSPHERNPFIRCFLDARFDRNVTDVHLVKNHSASVSGVLKEGYEITSRTALCFASIAWRNNETGAPCMLDTGVSHVTFKEISEGIKTHGKFTKIMHMIMHTADNLEKAQVEISIKELNCEFKAEPVGANYPQLISASINQYINATMQIEQSMQETFGPQTTNMRIPYDYSESGIQSTNGTPFPAVAFVMSETPKSNDHYWENAFTVVMDRDGLKPEHWERLNDVGKARAAVNTVCYIAQYLDYIGDTVDKNVKGSRYDKNKVVPYENFGDALGLISGDCEDSGGANLQSTNAILEHEFNPKGLLYPIMSEIQKILKQYVPPLSLDVVRGMQVSDNTVNYGAHMNDNFIPQHMFRKAIENTREGRLISKNLQWEPNEMDNLPFLVGEGTGMYEPYGIDLPNAKLFGLVYQCPSLEGFKKLITRKPGVTGNFFVGSLVGLTDFFFKRGANTPMSFWYTTNGKRGVSYDDMMNRPEKISIKIQPYVSKQLMNEISEGVLRRIPPEPLILSPLAKDAKRHHNSILEHICKSVDDFKRPTGNLNQKVPVFIRPHQITKQLANQIVSDFRKIGNIWKVDYKLEEITDKIFGYRMNVYVREK